MILLKNTATPPKQMQTSFPNRWKKGTANFQLWALALRRAALLCLLLAAPTLPAHPISLISCQALVHRDSLDMKIAVMPEDFLPVYGIYVNAQSRVASADITNSAGKHQKYVLDGLVVRDADGNRLEGKVVKMEVPALPVEGLLVTDLMSTTIVYTIQYPLAKQPTHLTFQHHFGGSSAVIPAIVDLLVTRDGLPTDPAVRIPGDENVVTVAFDWNETSRPAAAGDAATLNAPVHSAGPITMKRVSWLASVRGTGTLPAALGTSASGWIFPVTASQTCT
jgi:hypothetical protein